MVKEVTFELGYEELVEFNYGKRRENILAWETVSEKSRHPEGV